MRVVVTGHAGYVGSVLTPLLLRQGHEVRGIDCGLFERCAYNDDVPDIPTLRKDIRDVSAEDLAGADAVIHLAGLSNDPLGDLDPDLTDEINHLGTVRVARLAREAGVKHFLFASSCGVYGSGGEDMVNEDAASAPLTPYSHSKANAEKGLLALLDDTFSVTLLRIATAYGFSPLLRFDLVVNNLTAWAYGTGRVRLKSDGTAWRPLVHVEDISRAFTAVLESPRAAVHGRVFNIGRTDENYRIRDLAEVIVDTVPGCSLENDNTRGRDPRCYKVNCDQLPHAVPDFKPAWRVREGAQQLCEAFRERGVNPTDFEGSRFSRDGHVLKLQKQGLLDASLRWMKEHV